MKATLGRRLPCQASLGWRVVYVLLAIVFSVASTVPLAGQEPVATQRPGTQRVPDTHRPGTQPAPGTQRVPDTHRPGTQPAPDTHRPGTQPAPGTQRVPDTQTQTRGGDDRGLSDADWVKILGTLVAFGVVAFIVHWLKRPPKVEVVPVKDKDYYGEQHVAPSPLVLAVELCPVLDPGDQELDKVGPLVEQRGG